MTSGAKVVIAMLGAVGAIAIFAVIAVLVTNDDRVRCVEGELQDNAVGPDGRVRPRVETFGTLEEAEAFICHRIPHPRRPDDLNLTTVRVARERNLGDTIEGEGGASIELEYGASAGADSFAVALTLPPMALPVDTVQPITIRGEDAVLFNVGEVATAQWNEGAWTIAGRAILDTDFTLEDFLRVLESVR
jgi:hypothetical protein